MIKVTLEKRRLKKLKRNGQREWNWTLRWEAPDGKRRCESTGTADRTQADTALKAKWAELNTPVPVPENEAEPEPVKASWGDCREALKRAMQADNLRPSYVNDATLVFDKFREMFPDVLTPADITPEIANEFKRRRAEANKSPWSTRGDLATLKAVFGKWLMRECGLVPANPFENVKPPKCDDPEVRIVSAAESHALFAWLTERWPGWKLPVVYLEIAALLGWRATEIASIREDDLLPDGYVKVQADTSKTRKQKYGWLPDELYSRLKACAASGWAFGRFSDDLRRLLFVSKRRPHHAVLVKEFTPTRLVGWMQDELARFNDGLEKAAENERKPVPERFTLHDFRRTAITGLQMAGVSEKETSVMVGATPEVIRRHYEKLDQLKIARQSVERRLSVNSVAGTDPAAPNSPRRHRAEHNEALDGRTKSPQTASA
jgi:integrase